MAARGPGAFRFVGESWSELRKVTWPTAETVVRLTVIVLIISAIIGVYIFAFDNVFTAIITRPLIENTPAAP
jgi:preprotein translocase SecE subunit